jgi:hypothetical protein
MNTNETFESLFERVGEVQLPEFSGVRVMMLPVIVGDVESLPAFVENYKTLFRSLCEAQQALAHHGEVGYLTIDEKIVEPSSTHRRGGLHVDGVYQGSAGPWGGGFGRPGGSWGSVGNGMLTVSNPAGCLAYRKTFVGWPGMEGECDHLADQCTEDAATMFEPNVLYWVDGLCVHESVPMTVRTPRQFVRLSLPSDGPWFEGYTENPLGVKPTGEILPPRVFMNAG